MSKSWSLEEATNIFYLPFFDLIYKAHQVMLDNFPKNEMQLSVLQSVKTGGCSEDCAYCSQSKSSKSCIQNHPYVPIEDVYEKAKEAQKLGATRYCMAASGRGPSEDEIEYACKLIKAVKSLGMETCMSLGLLDENKAQTLKEAGLDYYNHNIDTSQSHYDKIISTRTFNQRIETIKNVRKYDIKVCCGGILGIGETNQDRIEMITLLANLDPYPDSIPINKLIPIPGTRLEKEPPVESFDFIRTIALSRILMPKAYVRLTAGRASMSEELQALCFFSGANSIFLGEKLLTAKNPDIQHDANLLEKLGLKKIAA